MPVVTTTPMEAVSAALEAGNVTCAMETLFNTLQNAFETMEASEWKAFAAHLREAHPLRERVYEDPMTRRAFEKPRGYAGDAVMMDFLYGIHGSDEADAGASDLGREIYRYIQERPAGQGVRFRREHLAALIDEMAAAKRDLNVLAIASGHLRETELSAAVRGGNVARMVALDADVQSLDEVDSRYGSQGVETVHASVRHLLARKVNLGTFDFVYAAGLFDYLSDAMAQALTARMFDLTEPGGQMLIPNFTPDLADRAYMETYMNWDLVYRDEYDMTRLLERVNADEIASYDVYRDPVRSIVFLRVWKKG